MLDLDISVVVISLMIWGLMIILNKLYFKPVGTVLHQREEKIAADTQLLEETTSRIETRTGEIEEKLKSAKRQALEIKERILREGEDVRDRMIAETRERSHRVMEERMSQLASDIESAERRLQDEVDLFSEKMKETFL